MRDTAGSAAATAARCRKFRRGSFIFEPPFTSLDHLVGDGEHTRGNGKAERFCGLEVDDQLELSRLHYRQVGRLFALENAARVKSDLSERPSETGSVTYEPADPDELSRRIHHRNRIACRKRGDLLDPTVKENIITDEQCPSSRLDQVLEGGIDFTVGASLQRLNLEPDSSGCRQHVSCYQLMNNWVVRVLQKANRRGFGHQLVQQRERLRPQLAIDLVEAREVTSRPIETSNKTDLNRIDADAEHDWDGGGRSLSCESRRKAGRDNHGHPNLDQINRQCG